MNHRDSRWSFLWLNMVCKTHNVLEVPSKKEQRWEVWSGMVDFSDDAEVKPLPDCTSMSEACSTNYICLHPIPPPVSRRLCGFQGDEEERVVETSGFSLLMLSCKISWNMQEQFMSRKYTLTFSFWCLAKLIQCFRFKNKIKLKKKSEA